MLSARDPRVLHAKVRAHIHDLAGYLETDSSRRQANAVVRLTVVTIFGPIGTITPGFLGMNLMTDADAPMTRRLRIFAITLIAILALTVDTIAKSIRLPDERLGDWAAGTESCSLPRCRNRAWIEPIFTWAMPAPMVKTAPPIGVPCFPRVA